MEWRRLDAIKPSLIYATNCIPFYKNWKYIDLNEIYTALPLVEKLTFVENHIAFLNPGLSTESIQYSSGYLTGIKTPVEKSPAETGFLQKFYSNSNDNTLNIYLKYSPSGDVILMDQDMIVVNLLEDEYSAPKLRQFASSVLGKRVRFLGLESQLRLLAHSIKKHNILFNCTEIVSGGDLVTAKLERFYKDTFKCPIVNRFGITEMFGGATKCSHCGLFHFDDHVFYDIHDITKIGQLEYVGKLSLSAIYPFNQRTFLLKYSTGDTVRLKFVDVCSTFGFELLGRTRQIIRIGDALFSPTRLYNYLDEIEGVVSSKLFKKNNLEISPELLGHLRFSTTKSGHTINVEICIKKELLEHSEYVKSARQQIALMFKQSCIGEISANISFCSEESAIEPFLPDEVED